MSSAFFMFQEKNTMSIGNLLLVCGLMCTAIPSLGAEKCKNDVNCFSRMQSSKSKEKRTSAYNFYMNFAAREGKRAVQKLLQGAEETPSYTYQFKSFQKSGGWEMALDDFQGIQLTNVAVYGGKYFDGINWDVMVGRAGDRNILLKKRGWSGKPSIEVMKLTSPDPHHLSDIITYID